MTEKLKLSLESLISILYFLSDSEVFDNSLVSEAENSSGMALHIEYCLRPIPLLSLFYRLDK